jgi:hypothetical protein
MKKEGRIKMGYTTDFEGQFDLDKPLSEEHKAYLAKFSGTRRMKRNVSLTGTRPDPVREAVGLPLGIEGGYFVGEGGFAGQEKGPDVIDGNRPPSGQPGLWCQWVPGSKYGEPLPVDGPCESIVWDGNEKFYEYVEWLEYLIKNFLHPWGYNLNGEVQWFGEERSDIGVIIVKDNKVTTKIGRIAYDR